MRRWLLVSLLTTVYTEWNETLNTTTSTSYKFMSDSLCPSNVTEILKDIEFDETTVVNGYNIGWIKLISCTEKDEDSEFTFHYGYNKHSIQTLLPFVISLRISPPGNASTNSVYDDFAVETVPCSKAVFALNNRKEMSWNINEFSFNKNYEYPSTIDSWIGTDIAKNRLKTDTTCVSDSDINKRPHAFPVIYKACDSYSYRHFTVDVDAKQCVWHNAGIERIFEQDMNIYFGFDLTKENTCKYELDVLNMTLSDNLAFVPFELSAIQAELFCEQQFNTTLAVLNTPQRIKEALSLRNTAGYHDEDTWFGSDIVYEGNDMFSWPQCPWLLNANLAVFPDEVFHSETETTVNSERCGEDSTAPRNMPFLCDRFNKVPTNNINCVFSHEEEIHVVKGGSETVSRDLLTGEQMTLSFEIKIQSDFVCNTTKCNILHIGDGVDIALPSIYIVGNDIEIHINTLLTYNERQFVDVQYKYPIHNGANLLCDGAYHHFMLEINDKEEICRVSIDEATYLWRVDYLIEYPNVTSYYLKGKMYPLYVSNPWTQSIEGMIRNLCIESNRFSNSTQWSVYDSIVERKRDYSLPIAYHNEEFILILDSVIHHRVLSPTQLSEVTKHFPERGNITWGQSEIADSYLYLYSNYHDLDWDDVESFSNWESVTKSTYFDYVEELSLIMWSQQFVQDEDKLYILTEIGVFDNYGKYPFDFKRNRSNSSFPLNFYSFAYQMVFDTESKAELLIFDLDTLSLQSTHIIPSEYYYPEFALDSCITYTTDGLLYIINQGIVIYDIINNEYTEPSINESDFNLIMVGCATTIQNDKIYIFGGIAADDSLVDTVYEYDIESEQILLLDKVKLKYAMYALRSIATGNNKIYLYGGTTDEDINKDTTNWRSVFNVKTATFEQDRAVYDPVGRYSVFSTAVYDKNTNLIIRYLSKKQFVDVLIVDEQSIDFNIDWIPTIKRWRSDVEIVFILNDFTMKNPEEGLYHFEMKYSNSTQNITYIMMIDDYDNMCYLCNGKEWNDDCAEFDVFCTAAIHDVTIDSIDITFSPINYDIQILYDDVLSIEFLKCNITYSITPNTVFKNNSLLFVNAEWNEICNGNTDPLVKTIGYIANIYNKEAQIDHDIIVNQPNICKICHHGYTDDLHCVLCGAGFEFVIDDNLENKGSFTLSITSVTTDLIVDPQLFNVIIGEKDKNKLTPVKIAAIVISSVVACGIILCLFLHNRRLKAEKERYKQDIMNPLVIFIGVGYYQDIDDVENPDPGLDTHIDDLNAVETDFTNIKTLCHMLNYDLYPKEKTLEWTQTDILTVLKTLAQKANSSLSTENSYDSILVICSGHGLKRSIVTSDHRTVSKAAVHRIFGANYPNLREMPRIFIFDCCDGAQERNLYKDDDDEPEPKKSIGDERGKNINESHTQIFIDDINKDDLWKRDEKNPDYKLVTIHAANLGFQAKASCVTGSYLITSFVEKISENINGNNNLFLGEIMDIIQQDLHDKRGKQQTVSTFNNHTRYLRFKKNATGDAQPQSTSCEEREGEVEMATKNDEDLRLNSGLKVS